MVLKVFYNNTEQPPKRNVFVYKDIDTTFFITYSYGGMKYLQFDIPLKHSLYKYMAEETRLEYDGQYYLIKGINERKSAEISTINAELDLTGLKNKIYISKKWTTESFTAFSTDILSGTGWTVSNAGMIGKRTTMEAKDETPRQLLDRCSNATSYGACFEFDTKNKVITCIKPENNTSPSGVYFTDELNLSELTLKGSSSSLVTKLYPIGKDGLTIKSVNNGKDYLENYTYTDKVVCAVWRDERYTNAQSLKDDGEVKLDALAKPERAYTCKVINLAKTNPEIYGDILPIHLYDIVTLIDRNRGTRINHRIVELREYPADHTLDTVVLSTVTGRISGKIAEVESRINELDVQQLHDRTKVNEIKQDLDTTFLRVSESWAESENSSMITQTSTGLYFDVSKAVGQGQWSTKLQQSATDIRIAWNNISRYIQFEDAALKVFTTNNDLLMKLDYDGSWFYHKDSTIGKIGTNHFSNHVLLSSQPSDWTTNYKNYYRKSGDTYIKITGNSAPTFAQNTYFKLDESIKGLVFDLESSAKYMCWAARDNAGDSYYDVKIIYLHSNVTINEKSSKKGFHLWTPTYADGNLYLDDSNRIVKFNSGGVGYTGKFCFCNAASGGDYTTYTEIHGARFTIYNGASINFYADLHMNGFNVLGQSDVRAKENLAPTPIVALDILNAVDMYEFDWRDSGRHVPLGIMAQQLQSVAPQLVATDQNGVLQIKMTDMIYYLIKAIQELSPGNYTKAAFNESDYRKFDYYASTGLNTMTEELPPSVYLYDVEEEEEDEEGGQDNA